MAKRKPTVPPPADRGSDEDAPPASASPSRPTSSQIRKLDRQIIALLNQRAAAALDYPLGERPSENSLPAELESIQAAAKKCGGPLSPKTVQAVFRELLSGIRAASRPTRVAYLGPEFTYSHLAAIARFGQSAELVPVASIASVFEDVERGQADFGVAPIENTTDGRIADSLDCLARSPVQICGEVPIRICHCLIGRGARSEITRVYSKTQPLSQCRNWLASHLPGIKLVETASTAEAANLAAADSAIAAIAAEQAAVNHGLNVLARNIEDNPDNITRFAIIGAAAAERTGNDKTAIVFEAPHQPGALADATAIFKRHKLNLTWIESFPIPGARWRYLFFVEFQGHPSELRVRRALLSLGRKALRLTLLGSYAQAEPIG